MIHIDYLVTDECINIDTYGVICVQCNCCGRFGEESKREAQIEYYKERIKSEEAFDNWDSDEGRRKHQEKVVQENINYYKAKLAEIGGGL
jgi:hypothetical protein